MALHALLTFLTSNFDFRNFGPTVNAAHCQWTRLGQIKTYIQAAPSGLLIPKFDFPTS